MRRPSRIGRSLLFLLSLSGLPLYGQATLSGIVRHDSSGTPIGGVEVLINGTPYRTETNSQGRYLLENLPAGIYQAIFRKLGHLPVRVDVRLISGDTTRANTSLIESAVILDPVVVTGTAETSRGVGIGREAFDERRKMGFGRFLDPGQLREVDTHLHLDDALRRLGGVEIQKIKWKGQEIWTPMNWSRRGLNGGPNCFMQVYYNGVPIGRGGVNGTSVIDPADLRMFPLSGLDAVEVYRSPAEVPQEYGGASAGCGVVLLWSRLKP